MAYSEVEDLLLGDIVLNPTLDRQKTVDNAAEEMDSKLGWVYELPLHPENVAPSEDSWKQLPSHQVLLLKNINNKLASGRLILALAVGQEGSTLHAYGWQLVREANEELILLANGTIDLDAVVSTATDTSESMAPSIIQYDDESLLAGFENTVLRGQPWYSRPGSVA